MPLVADVPWSPECGENEQPKTFKLNYYVDYDRGIVIRPFDPDAHPFELKVNGWIQFRHHAFARSATTWTDNAGVTRPIRNRNAFDIERGRIVLSGFAVDQRLRYFLQLDGDTDGAHLVDFFDYWWGWKFSDLFQLQVGKRKVPGSRQWLMAARRTRFSDRPMANDFFRPDRTIGIFGVGQLNEVIHYEVMLGNGYSSSNVPNADSDQQFTFAATNYFDPWGNFGGEIVDYDYTEGALVRFGHSFVYSPNSGDTLGIPLGEADFVRLSDGTRLTETGAIAPGVTISSFDVVLYGLDFAWKSHGWSIDAEVFLRWLNQLEGNGALPVTSLFQHGYYVEGGRFLVAKKLDFNLRYSQVSGEYGNSSEYAAGINWYPTQSNQLKVSFDVTTLDGSPLQNRSSDILVGDAGTLFRTQFQAEF
ncbi:porin [Bremerella sp.]|uniref:porin n=1 Tax=Bremerella sp. TaxID=2795602 RepID=UPI00391981D2